MDYRTYKKIINYLDKDELEQLREYLYQEFYIKNARKYLDKYLKKKSRSKLYIPLCTYTDDNKLILCDYYSIYELNNDEILTKARINKINDMRLENKSLYELSTKIINEIDPKTLFKSYKPKIYSEFDLYKLYVIFSKDYTKSEYFLKENLDYAKYFLGFDLEYSLVTDKHACYVESEKGKGLVLACRKEDFNG